MLDELDGTGRNRDQLDKLMQVKLIAYFNSAFIVSELPKIEHCSRLMQSVYEAVLIITCAPRVFAEAV